MNVPSILILVGTLITAIGGLWASYREEQEKARSAGERANFEAELKKRSEEQRDKGDQIAALMQEVLRGVTTLRTEGKITREDARRVFPGVFAESLQLDENLEKKVIPGAKQNP